MVLNQTAGADAPGIDALLARRITALILLPSGTRQIKRRASATFQPLLVLRFEPAGYYIFGPGFQDICRP